MKKLATVTALGLAMVGAVAFAGTKIGVVNYVNVFKQAPQGNAKLESLKATLKPQVDKLKSEQKALSADVKKLQRNAPTLSKSDRKKQEGALATKQQAFQKDVMALRGTEMKQEQAAAKAFEADLQNSIKSVAKAGGYDIVLSKQAAPYVASSLNLTKQVIAEMKKAK